MPNQDRAAEVPLLSIVDDDDAMRNSTRRLISTSAWLVTTGSKTRRDSRFRKHESSGRSDSVFSQVEQADQANDNEIDCHDKIKQPWHDQN